MQADQQQQWTLYVHAKAKNVDFKLKATKILPTTNFFRFSILFKVCPFLIRVKSQPQVSIFPRKQKSLKSKFLGILEKFPTPRAKNKANAARKTSNIGHFRRCVAYKGPICVSSVIVGNLALLYQSICEKNQKGVIIHSLVILLYLASLLKNFIGRKTSHLLVILSVAMVGCSVVGHMKNYLSYDKGSVPRYMWKAWNYAASSGYLYLIFQVIFSGVSQLMGIQRSMT